MDYIMGWKNFNEEKPVGNERILVCEPRFHEVRILVYNDFHECWDTEDGDDYYCDLDKITWWMSLPVYKD